MNIRSMSRLNQRWCW